jgi:hypothetical protein
MRCCQNANDDAAPAAATAQAVQQQQSGNLESPLVLTTPAAGCAAEALASTIAAWHKGRKRAAAAAPAQR